MGEGPSNQQTPALWGLHGQFMVAVQHNLDTTNNNLWNIYYLYTKQTKSHDKWIFKMNKGWWILVSKGLRDGFDRKKLLEKNTKLLNRRIIFWFHKTLIYYWSSQWFKPKKPNFHTWFRKPANNLNQFWNIKISEENSCIGSGQHD